MESGRGARNHNYRPSNSIATEQGDALDLTAARILMCIEAYWRAERVACFLHLSCFTATCF
jgi:hypothetical protein